MNTSTNHQSSRGFTMVELLVVIAILAVLAALTLSVATGARRAADRAVTSSQMRELGVAMIGFTSDNNSRFPDRTGSPRWDRLLLDQMGYEDAFESREGLGPTNAPGLDNLAETFAAKDDKAERRGDVYPCSFTIPGWTCNANGGRFRAFKKNTGVPLTIVNSPASASMILQKYRAANVLGLGTHGYAARGGPISELGDFELVIFVDGHLESVPTSLTTNEFKAKYWPLERN